MKTSIEPAIETFHEDQLRIAWFTTDSDDAGTLFPARVMPVAGRMSRLSGQGRSR